VLLGVCAGGGLLPYVLVIVVHNYLLGLVVMGWFGVMMSGDAPSIYSLVAKQFASQAGVAFALVQAFGAIGATAGPWLTGWLGEQYGLQRAIWFGPGFLFTLAAATLTWEFVDRARGRLARFTPAEAGRAAL
jgi:MFS family permease